MDQVPVQQPVNQQAPVTAPDLSVNSGLIDNRPLQAPLPATNLGLGQGGTDAGQPKTIAQYFNSIKTPSDEKEYLSPDRTPQQLTKRYANWDPYIDNEEIAAKNQPWYNKWANALVKTGATTLSTLAQSIMTVPDTIKAIGSGKFSDLYQSDLENGADTWMKNLEDEFPNYYSKWEQTHPWLSALPFSGGGANFWADKVVKNLGFTIGAIGGAALQDVAVGAASEGIGELPLVGAQIGKAALWLNKVFSTETKLGEFLGATKPGLLSTLKGTAEAAGASENAMLSMTDLARAASLKKITDAGRFAVNLYGAARTESGFEARDGFNQVKQDLIDQFKLTNNRDPNQEETKDMEKYATAGANVRFGANMALLTVSDAIQFDNILKPFSAGRKGITASLQKSLEEDAEKIGIKEGTVDTFERKIPTTTSGKIWNAIKPTIPNILSEGVYEEGGQYAAQVATQNYYERKYYADKGIPQGSPDQTPWDPDTVTNVLHSTAQGLAGEFGTTEGWENIILGGITAVLTGGFEHFYDKLNGNHNEKSIQATISTLNDHSITGLLQNMFGNTNKSAFLAKEMQDAVATNDLFKYKNKQSELFTNFVLAHLQANRFEVAMEKLNIAKDLPQAEFEKAFGIENANGNKQTVGAYIDALKEKAEGVKNNYDAINEVFQNPYKFNSKAKTKDDVLQNDKHTKFEEWKATLLEHTSNIEDANKRLGEMNQKVAKANPAVTREMVQNLTHPVKLAQLATSYETQAAEIQKSFEDKLVTSEDRKSEEKQLKAYTENAAQIRSFLTGTEGDKNQEFLHTFDNLLHFQINGEDANTQDPVEIRKQVLPGLIRDGVDANRLLARKTVAAKAYDILTSEKGFNKYFSLLQDKENKSAELSQYHPIDPVNVNTEGLSVPVKTADGKNVTFKEGEQYTVNTGTKDNPEAHHYTYNGVDDEGNLKFTGENKEQVSLDPSKISLLGEQQKEVGDEFKKTLTNIGSGNPVNSTEAPPEEDSKKDLTRGPRSTTDPKFSDTTPFNNFHKRHQTFLFNLGSTDSDKFDQSVKPTLRIMPITAKTAEALGFPKNFAENRANEEDTIRAVYVSYGPEGKPYLLDEKGKKVQDLDGSPIDPSKIIFSTLPDTSLQYQGGERYTNKANLDSAKVQEWQKNVFRKSLLAFEANQMPAFRFQVSRGLPNIINQESRNTVTSVGLVTEKDLHNVVITIPTQGDVAIAALLNDEGEGIAADNTGVNMPVGVPLLNHGGNLIFLNNRKLTDKESSNAYNLIQELAKRVQSNKKEGIAALDQTILRYLSRILYFSPPIEGKVISPNQIWIDGQGMHFGTSFTVPFFENSIIGNKDRINAFLRDSYHNVNNYELSRVTKEKAEDLKFNELTMKDGKLVSQKEWPSYQHYLLTSDNAPLATNIAKPQEGELPIIQKYSVLQVKSFDNKAFQSDKKVEAPPKPAIPSTKKREAQQRPSQKRIFWSRHSQDFGDTEKITSGNGDSQLTPEGITKAKKLAEEMLDKGVTNIVTSTTSRAQQTAKIVGDTLGIPVDSTSQLAHNLRSWDIGQWSNIADADFDRAEKYFTSHPTEKEFEGKKLNESFKEYSDRVISTYQEAQKTLEEGTMVITHSMNLNVIDAFNKTGESAGEKFVNKYLENNAPENAELTTESSELKSNEVQEIQELPDGRKIKYAKVYDSNNNLVDVRIISGIRKDGFENKNLDPKVAGIFKNLITDTLGLTAPTPTITATPTVKEVAQAKEEVKKEIEEKKPRSKTSESLKKNLQENINKVKEKLNRPNASSIAYKLLGNYGNFYSGGKVYTIKDKTEYGFYSIYDGDKLVMKIAGGEAMYERGGMSNDDFFSLIKNMEVNPNYEEEFSNLLKFEEKDEVKEEIPPSSAASKLLGHKAPPKDTQYRAANVIPGSYEQGNLEEEFEKVKSMLPDYVQFVTTKNLIKMTGGGKAWGAMKDAAIYVYKNAEAGTTYHEAFELVWQNFLEGKQQLALYNEFKERDGTFNNFRGKETKFSDANFAEAKEQLAEEFRNFVLKGTLPDSPKQRNWFQRLVDFIKNIFLGPQQDINQLFKNINEGYYKNYPASQKSINSIEYRNIQASEAFVQDVLQGMTADLFAREFEKDSAIVTQLEENPKQAVATVYGRLFNSMQYFFTSDDPNASETLQAIYHDKITQTRTEAEQANVIQEFEGVQNQWEFIKNNWNEFVNEHMQYLRVFKVEFSVDDNGEVTMDSTARRNLEDYEKMTGQSEYARDIMTINARNTASEKVKLLFSTIADREFQKYVVGQSIDQVKASQGSDKTRIKRENSQVRMPKLAAYAKVFNYVLHNVTNINGIYDIYKKLVTMSNNTRVKANAVVDALVNRLDFKSGFKGKSVDQAKMILSVENTLNKQKPDFVRQFVDENNNVYFKTSIINSKVDQVVDNWITSMKSADAVKATPDSNFIFHKSVGGIKDPVELLNTIGIQIQKEDYEQLSPGDKTKFNNEVNALRSVLNQNTGKKLPIFTTKQLGIDSRLINLASLYVDKIAGDDTDSMHFNLDSELTSNFVLPNYTSAILTDANNSKPNNPKAKAEFIAKNPQFNDIFHQDSILLNDILFDKDGKFTSPINVAVVEGREAYDSDNKPTHTLSEAERYVYEINNNLQGIFYTLLPADAKTEWAIYSGQYIKASEYFDEITHENAVGKFTDRMYSNLQTEIALAKDFQSNPNRQNITELNKLYEGRRKGESLRFFQDILFPEMAKEINTRVIDGSEDLEKVMSKEVFSNQIKAWVNDKADKSFNYLTNNKIFGVQDTDSFKLNGLLTEFISKNLGPKRKYFTKEETTRLLTFREMNYAINNIEMHKFFFGDPAQYSDEMKRIKSFLSGREWSHVDTVGTAEGFNQWANGTLNTVGKATLQPGDPGYHIFKNDMNTLTLKDIIVKSSYLDMLEKVLGSDAKPYKEMNEADAQTLQRNTSYRETLLKAGGRWSQKMEDQHQWELAWERQDKAKEGKYKYSSDELEKADIQLMKKSANPDAYFYITKPIHSGIQAKENTAIVSLDKTSSFPLYYRFVKGSQLEDLYNAMQEKGTDYVRVVSAHKVGIQTDSTLSLYNEDGSINSKGVQEATHEQIPYKYYGIQVDTSSKKESQTEGSQLRNQATGDLMNAGVPVDFKASGWERMTEEEREKASPVYTLVKQHKADLTAMSNKRYQNLISKLGATENEDGTYSYKSVKKMSDFLLNEVTRRELPNNLKDAIQPDPNDPSQFAIPLEALSNYQQVRAILWSTIEKNIIRPKVSGGMKVQLAATGWEKAHRVQVSNVNGKQVLTSSELKFYTQGENGTTKCEVYLPFWFGSKLRVGLEKKGKNFSSDEAFRDHILEYLNRTPEGQKLLGGIGFRIPTQRDNSIESFIVKNFLPEQMGDTIIFPSEITAKAGSDFDIDKMNTYLRNFFINKEGYPEATPFENIDSNDPQQLKDYYEKYMLEKNREYEQWHKEKTSRDFVNNIFGSGDEDKEPEYVPSLEEYLHQSQGKSAYELNSLEALENKYFDTLEKIYALPEKFKGLVSPNDAGDLKEIAQKISKLKDPNWSETKQPYGRVLDSLWMMQERHKYLVGKKGVGIAAVSQTNLNVNQQAKTYITLPRGVQIRLPFNKVVIEGAQYPSLSAIKNVSGENISKVNASFIDGYVDIAKGAWIIDMGADDNTAKDFLLMNKWGSDPYEVALFMNQPAIQMYIKEQSTRKSVSQINEAVKLMNSRQLYSYVSSQFKPGVGKAVLAKTKPALYSKAVMEDMIRKYGNKEPLTNQEARLQMQMLSDYQDYAKLGWDLFRFVQGYNWDTARLNDPNLTRRKLIAQKVAEESNISSVSRVLQGSFIGTVRDNTLKVDNALRSLISLESGRGGEILDAFAQDLSERRGVTQEDYRKAMAKVSNSLLDYVIQTGVNISGKALNRYIGSLLLSDNSSARYLKAIQESGDQTLTTNPIIQNLRPNIDKREGKPSNIELIEKDNDSYTSNIWTDAFRELADNQSVISIDDNPKNDLSVSQIYRRMVLTSILQSGSKRSKISFNHLIPSEHYNAIIGDVVRNLKADLDAFYDKNVAYRTNWDDDTLVPTVPPTPFDDFSTGHLVTRRTYPGISSTAFNQHLKDQGIDNPPRTLKLDVFNWQDKKVVKTVDYKRDPSSKQITEKIVRLFQRVDTGNGEPLIASRGEIVEGEPNLVKTSFVIYKEINKWGDGNKVQEYYDDNVHSALDTNPHIAELEDEQVIYGLANTGYEVNLMQDEVSDIASRIQNRPVVQGESEADTEQEPADIPQPANKEEINFKSIELEDTKRSSKKDFYHITDSAGEVGEAEGYKVTVKSHPDLDLYVRKRTSDWSFSDNKTGKQIAWGDTAKEAIEKGVVAINSAIKRGDNKETLTRLGVAREIDDILKDKDGGCK